MRHRKAGKHLGRDSSHRRAMFRNMVTSLFRYEQIETTDAKAKQLKPIAERMITLAKRGDLHARRQALAYMMDKRVTHRLFDELKDRFMDRQGGYVRIIKKGNRKGDNAPISIVQLISAEEAKKKKKKRAKPEAKKAVETSASPATDEVSKEQAEQPPEGEGDK
ncbi:MAG: 50S ribosomal protein L17 [Deltaproteobacteria bacterium]|nr:50S ribosomal protein L17 [Deltaproteobacteria bacterium]MBW1930932.1 50S ribosomal protein L17 [Deltaproteobacteria bacterium]MBW2024891.1 50S ribosomal protein L17 [Deltaproteobacteria bacterium]MBW2125437.1 50S ribosomal protein L17 [Deltaproteobacteria bacterium]RLB19600.1 MAG: 50S ribosomal protein L17 [Deltaproteobacteria bacterium]